jgi:hypothetical protein
MMMPPGQRKRYKKFSRKIPIRLTPHKVSALESFESIPLADFLVEEIGIAPGEEVEAVMHLYESIPGTHLPDIARVEGNTPGLGNLSGYEQLHPLTREAAGLLLGEPELGRDVSSQSLFDPHSTMVGQRFYYLEIPGWRSLMAVEPTGRTRKRRTTRVRLILDFPKNEIRVRLFLSEIRAQEVAVKLRQHAHIGMVTSRLRGFLERGLRSALIGTSGRLKIVHEAVTPDQWPGAFRRLPSLVPQVLLGRLTEWVVKGISDHLKQNPEDYIKAANDTADGVALAITLSNPPGFPQLRQALKGSGLSIANLKMSGEAPTVKIKMVPGHVHE